MPGESFCHLSKITMVYIYKVLTFVVMKISVSENNKRPRTTLIMNIIIWAKQVWGVALQYTLLGGGSKGMLLHNLKFEVLWNVISGIQGCMWVTFLLSSHWCLQFLPSTSFWWQPQITYFNCIQWRQRNLNCVSVNIRQGCFFEGE